MGFTASTTAQVRYDDARIAADRLLGTEGQGFKIALAALDGGRLGIAAVAVGLAQAAFDTALAWAEERRQFGRPIVEFQGLGFLLADMATGIEAGRSLYVEAARRRDRGEPFGKQAAMAKLFCTDMAMKVTTDAVQVLGGYGYVQDFPVERYLREAKALQIVEGTNQVQRMVIARHLTRSAAVRIGCRSQHGHVPDRPCRAELRAGSRLTVRAGLSSERPGQDAACRSRRRSLTRRRANDHGTVINMTEPR